MSAPWRLVPRALVTSALALAIVTAAGPTRARADATSDDQLGKVFEQGLERFDAGDPRGAIALWAPLVEAEPERAWRALYNLGLAYEAAGDAAAAVGAFDRFVRRVGQLPGAVPEQVEERRQDAVERAASLRATLGLAEVRGDAPIAGVVVSVDGAAHQTLPLDVYLAPGPHEIVAIAGDRRHAYPAVIARGETARVLVRAADLAPPPAIVAPAPPRPPPIAPPVDAPRFPTAWVIAGAGLTLASFAFPIGFGVDAWNRGNEAGALGIGHTRYADASAAYASARTRYYATYAVPAVLGAATLAVAIGGAIRVALGPDATDGAVAIAVSASGASVTVVR